MAAFTPLRLVALQKMLRIAVEDSFYFQLRDFDFQKDCSVDALPDDLKQKVRSIVTVSRGACISYRFKAGYQFFIFPFPFSSDEYSCRCFFKPGVNNFVDYRTATLDATAVDKKELVTVFTDWLRSIKAELTPMIFNDPDMDALLAEIKLSDETFTEAQQQEIHLKLERRLEEIEQALQALNQDASPHEVQALKSQIASMRRDIQVLQEQLHTFTQKDWAGSFVARYQGWPKKIIDMLKLESGIQMVSGFLTAPDDGQEKPT